MYKDCGSLSKRLNTSIFQPVLKWFEFPAERLRRIPVEVGPKIHPVRIAFDGHSEQLAKGRVGECDRFQMRDISEVGSNGGVEVVLKACLELGVLCDGELIVGWFLGARLKGFDDGGPAPLI